MSRPDRPRRRATALRILLVLAALSLSACGDDPAPTDPEPAAAADAADPEPADPPATEPDPEPTEPDAAEPDPEPTDPDEPHVEVELVDFAFVGLPDTIAAGTRLSVVNTAEAELHELVAFRLPDEEERSVPELLRLPPEEAMPILGEPAAVLLAAPGGPQIAAVGDGVLDEPGRYAIVCFIPTGVEPQVYLEAAAATESGPPQVEGGPPHLAQGMYAELIVE